MNFFRLPHNPHSRPNADDAHDRVIALPVDRIFPNPYQPRRFFRADALEGLAASVRRHGILVPILVCPIREGSLLICGERRLRAAKLAGQKTIPAIERALGPAQMLELALLENLHREPLSALEQADALVRIGTEFESRRAADIAKGLGLPAEVMAAARVLSELPWLVKRAVLAGLITPAQAVALARIPGEPAQISSLAAVWARKLSLEDTIRLADAVRLRLAS